MRGPAASAAALLGLLLVAACTSTEATLDPSAIAPTQSQQTDAATAVGEALPPPGGTAAAQPSAPEPQTAAISSAARIQLAPIVGATVETVTPLTRGLSARARERGVRLVPATEPSATHVMKGYFSAISEGRETIVIYVWDVLDPSGNRLHRIQGQERVTGTTGEGWSAVSPAAMEAIAGRTVDDLAAWLAAQPG